MLCPLCPAPVACLGRGESHPPVSVSLCKRESHQHRQSFQHPEPFNSADKRCCNFGLCKLKNEANQPPLLYLLLFMVSAQSFTELESEGSPAQSEVTAW